MVVFDSFHDFAESLQIAGFKVAKPLSGQFPKLGANDLSTLLRSLTKSCEKSRSLLKQSLTQSDRINIRIQQLANLPFEFFPLVHCYTYFAGGDVYGEPFIMRCLSV
jgi:hypothetical protein